MGVLWTTMMRHLLSYQRKCLSVIGRWSNLLRSICSFINDVRTSTWAFLDDEATCFYPIAYQFNLSRLGAAQYLAFRWRCNWNASTLAVFIVGLQRFALLGPVHRFVFRRWKAATLVTCLFVRESDSSDPILPERKMNLFLPYDYAVRPSLMSSDVLCEHFTLTIMTLIFWIDINMNNLFYNVLYHSWIFWITIIASSILFYISIN